jgi:hypothetical protein
MAGEVGPSIDNTRGSYSNTLLQSLSVVDLFYMPYFHHLEATVSPGFLHSRKNLARWWSTLKTRECYRALTGV